MLNVPSIIKRIIAKNTFKYKGNEFGGWVIFNENDEVLEDVIIDTQLSTGAFVRLSATSIMKQPPELRNRINGWFHSHPITGLSGMDEATKEQLTRLWGTCYTIVLQSDDNILIVKSIIKDNKVEDVFKYEVPIGFKTYNEPSIFTGIFRKGKHVVTYDEEVVSDTDEKVEDSTTLEEPTVVIQETEKKKGEEHLPEIYE
jgi:hypothetical protein